MFEMVNTPEELGISSRKLLEFIDHVEANKIEIHSAILMRHGKEACRMNWKPYSIDAPHMLFSLSKSFTSCAVGFAVAEGLLSYDTRVADVLADKLPEHPSERLLKITLGDLLCMGSGLDPKSDGTPEDGGDWCRHVLGFEVTDEPGTHFNYNSLGTYLCSAMVTRVTGQTCRDYLWPRMFEKIGIEKPVWDESPQGINCGGWGLHLSCESIAKFGTLLLNDGVWNGERVLPEGWVGTAMSKHIENYRDNINDDWQQGYGYQFWACREGRWRGDGMCGQICMVSKREDAVLAITAGVTDMGAELNAIHDYFMAAIDAQPGTPEEQEALKARIAGLEYSFPDDDGSGHDVSGKYVAQDGGELIISDNGDVMDIIVNEPERKQQMPLHYARGGVQENEFNSHVPGAPVEKCLCGFGWRDGVLRLMFRFINGPFYRVDEISFDGDKATDKITGTASGEQTIELKKS